MNAGRMHNYRTRLRSLSTNVSLLHGLRPANRLNPTAASLTNVLVHPMSISGAWLFTPTAHKDDRGLFLESFTQRSFQAATGFPLEIQQTNVSTSCQGTIRGIHFADVPPGQAKYILCYAGRILDVVVDLRVGSSTFGCWDSVELDSNSMRALYVGEGLGHAFCALTSTATVGYLCSSPYNPSCEHGISPLDQSLGITWPADLTLRLSPKDAAAPTLSEALELGILPNLESCDGLHDGQIIR